VPELPSVNQHRHAVEALYHLTKTLDATRPVIGNDGWESTATDIIGIHDYDANSEHIAQRYGTEMDPRHLFDRRRPGGRILTLDGYPHRGQPIMLTEFGGIAYVKGRAPTRGAKAWGYSRASSERQFLRQLQRLMHAVVTSPLFSGFCYTQFTDTFQEVNGLLTTDRSPKIPLKEIAKAVKQTRTHIQGGV
jgi:hypothetical protein